MWHFLSVDMAQGAEEPFQSPQETASPEPGPHPDKPEPEHKGRWD